MARQWKRTRGFLNKGAGNINTQTVQEKVFSSKMVKNFSDNYFLNLYLQGKDCIIK